MEAAVDRAPLVVGDDSSGDDHDAVLDDVRIAEVDLAAGHPQRAVGLRVAVAVRPLDGEVLALELAYQGGPDDAELRRGSGGDHGRSTTLVASRSSNMR